MQSKYWHNKWQQQDIGFHLSETYPLLIKYFSDLPQGTVLVPLCGKSLDMLWLRDQGHQVIGVELSAVACEAFFQENHLNFSVEEKADFKIYQTPGITIWCGDVLQLPFDACKQVTAIYDRAALFALPESMRRAYAEHLKKLIYSLSHVVMLLITIEYPKHLLPTEGPPFSLTEHDIHALYGDVFHIQKCADDVISAFQDRPKFKGIAIQDYAYLLTCPKQQGMPG